MGLTRQEAERCGLGDLYPPEAAKPKRYGGKRAPSHVRFFMNGTEQRYAEMLESQRLAGEIRDWCFEQDTFILAPTMSLTPDFRVEELDGRYSFTDVKRAAGWSHEDSIIKTKTAAVLFPQHRWFIAAWVAHHVTKRGKFVDGHWRVRDLTVSPGKTL